VKKAVLGWETTLYYFKEITCGTIDIYSRKFLLLFIFLLFPKTSSAAYPIHIYQAGALNGAGNSEIRDPVASR